MSEHLIQMRGIVNRFGDQVVHDGVDLDVRRGEVLGIVGGSGAGKTVLLNCMIGLSTPREGEVRVFGQALLGSVRERCRALRSRAGVVFQQGGLFSALTVAENVGFPVAELGTVPGEIERALVNFKLAAVGLSAEDGDKLPAELSGGMARRAALARALVLDPELLFLDEPTSGLDPVSARAFVRLLDGTRRAMGLTVVMVTHDRETVTALSDRVAVLADRGIIGPDSLERIADVEHPFVQAFFHPEQVGEA